MATDLFNQYYNNPKKSSIYADIICSNGASGNDIVFDIEDSAGIIRNEDGILASIDLSDINVPMTQYTSDMKIIDPYSYVYVKGMIYGNDFTSKSYGRIIGEFTEDEMWMYRSVLFFVIKYLDLNTGKKVVMSIKLEADEENGKTFIDVFNEWFESREIPVVLSYDNGYLVFTSTKLGYDFWIDHVLLWKSADDVDLLDIINQWIVDHGLGYKYGWDDEYMMANAVNVSNPYISKNVYSSVIVRSDYERLYNLMNCLDTDFQEILEEHDVKKIYLFEDITKYVPPRKYRNGAMLGCIVKATYPMYNDASISEPQRSLRIGHLVDRIQEFYAIPESLFNGTFIGVRKLIDVVDNYHSEYDSDAYNRWMGQYSHINGGDNWIDSDEVPQVVPAMFTSWLNSSVPMEVQALSIYKDMETRDGMGLDGYCAYLSKSNGWMNMGQLYARTAAPDDEEHPEVRNLITSFVIYNPNPFPVAVNYLTFG